MLLTPALTVIYGKFMPEERGLQDGMDRESDWVLPSKIDRGPRLQRDYTRKIG